MILFLTSAHWLSAYNNSKIQTFLWSVKAPYQSGCAEDNNLVCNLLPREQLAIFILVLEHWNQEHFEDLSLVMSFKLLRVEGRILVGPLQNLNFTSSL